MFWFGLAIGFLLGLDLMRSTDSGLTPTSIIFLFILMLIGVILLPVAWAVNKITSGRFGSEFL